MEKRKNILMDVTPKEQKPSEPIPEPAEPVPTEKEIFQKKSVESVAIPAISEPKAREPPKKEKRACSDKMRAHLANCRIKAQEKKDAIKRAKAKPKVKSIPQLQAIPEARGEPQQLRQAETNHPQHTGVDYDRIINGVTGKLQKQKEEDKWIQDYETRIRTEEREKAKNEYGKLFMDAATKFKKKTYAGYGRQAIYGNARQLNHPTFGTKYKYEKDSNNPFDKCFN